MGSSKTSSQKTNSYRTASYKNIVILTGAGISAESGIKTFRAQDGLWENHRIEDVATPEAYIANPELVQTFYNQRRSSLQDPNIAPNPAHIALAQLEQQITAKYPDGKVTVITQNIDNLHERAGTQSIIHMHGELLKVRCPESNQITTCDHDLTESDLCHCCQIPNPLRPHIVWFGEMPLQMAEIYDCLETADLFISIGTSGVVYPAAGLVNEAKMHGAHSIEINLEPSAVNSEFAEQRIGKASVEVPKLVEELLS